MQLKESISSELFSLILDGMYHAVVSVDVQGRIVIFNSAAERIFGYSQQNIIGENLDRLIPEDHRRAHAEHMRDFTRYAGNSRMMGNRGEIKCLRSDGTIFPAEASIMVTEQQGAIFSTAIIRDLSDRVRWQKELEAALHRAEEANRLKSRLMANLSHELRTPLNAIIGFSDALISGAVGQIPDGKVISYLKDINVSGKHLYTLVADLLDMSVIESGAREMNFEAIDPLTVIANAVSMASGHSSSSPPVNISIEQNIPKILADRLALSQILVNLISNAIKFNARNGTITVSARSVAGSRAEICVSDQGKGIPPEETDRIFEPFYQVGSTYTAKPQGVGMGLSIVKSLVDKMDGAVEVASVLNQGTSFKVTLPFVGSQTA